MLKSLSRVLTRNLKLSPKDELNGDVLSNLYENLVTIQPEVNGGLYVHSL